MFTGAVISSYSAGSRCLSRALHANCMAAHPEATTPLDHTSSMVHSSTNISHPSPGLSTNNKESIATNLVQAVFAKRTRYLRGLQAPTHVHAESPNLTAHQLLSETQYALEARNLNPALYPTLHQAHRISSFSITVPP